MQVIPPDPNIHFDELVELLCEFFHDGVTSETVALVQRELEPASPYDWQAARIGLISGRIVAHIGIIDYQMRIGATQLRTAGLSGVVTRPSHRGRGLMRQTMEAMLDGLLADGYDISLLFGIDHFYDRFGYVRAWSERVLRVEVKDLPDTDAGDCEDCKETYPDELVGLYNREKATATGTDVRVPCGVVLGQSVLHLWREDGAAAGYVLCECGDEKLLVREAVGDPYRVLAVCRQQAKSQGREVIEFISLSAADPLYTVLQRGTCREIVDHRRNGRALVRVVDLTTSLRKLVPTLSRRLSMSPLAGWRGVLCLTSGAQTAHLELNTGAVRVTAAQHTPHALEGAGIAQLLIGTDNPDELMASDLLLPVGEAPMLARTLFPAQHPMLSQFAQF